MHKELIVVCFRKGNKQEVREFGAATRELLELADWLRKGGCEGCYSAPPTAQGQWVCAHDN